MGTFNANTLRGPGGSGVGTVGDTYNVSGDTTAPNVPAGQSTAGNTGQFTSTTGAFVYSLVKSGDDSSFNALSLYANEETKTFYQQGKDVKTPIRFFKLVPVALKNCPKGEGSDACSLVAKLSDIDPKALGLITVEENGERDGASYNVVEYAIMDDEALAEGRGDLKYTQLQAANLTEKLNKMMGKGGLEEVLRYLGERNYDLSILLRLVNDASLKPEVRNAVLTQIAKRQKGKQKKVRPAAKTKTPENRQKETEKDKAKLQKLRQRNR